MTEQTTAPRVTPADIEAQIVVEHYFTAQDGVRGATGFNEGASLSLLTFCVLVLRNGFTVTGEWACASPELFSSELGRRIARQHAVDKVWPLLGFCLRNELSGQRPMQTTTPASIFDDARRVIDSQPVETEGRTFYDPRTGQWHGPAAPKGGAWSDGSSANAPLETSEAGARPYLLPHQLRVIEERDQLDERLTKLQQFIEHLDDGEVAIDGHERQRLIAQEIAMSNYLDILDERIDQFPQTPAA